MLLSKALPFKVIDGIIWCFENVGHEFD